MGGDYRIVSVLGAGGFGITYRASDLRLDADVAIKEYFPGSFARRDDTMRVVSRSTQAQDDYAWGLDRFLQEAQTLARFKHPNIVRVSRVFEDNNTAYMVLDLEQGQSFGAWLKGLRRPPAQEELDSLLPSLLDALDMIHENGVLHRDIAPDNFYIREDGSPVLLDFGSARQAIGEHSKALSAVIKSGYSPAEQYATSAQQGAWTDIYAMGATLYYAITGSVLEESTTRLLEDRVEPLESRANGSYRRSFLQAIDHAIRPRPEDRPQSVSAWREALLGDPSAGAGAPDGEASARREAATRLARAPAGETRPSSSTPAQSEQEAEAGSETAAPSLWKEWRATLFHLGLYVAAYWFMAENGSKSDAILVAELYALVLIALALWHNIRYWAGRRGRDDAAGNRIAAANARLLASGFIAASLQVLNQRGDIEGVYAFLGYGAVLFLLSLMLSRREDPWVTRLLFLLACIPLPLLLIVLLDQGFWDNDIAHFTPPVIGTTAIISMISLLIARRRRSRASEG
ncbi:MAG: hypothetical protein D6773_18080 [Alphaproteobacteria bacterium]|nr:MAG: hypothetical protein D6773_18080 [Alphaproteobacteria bacterium]